MNASHVTRWKRSNLHFVVIVFFCALCTGSTVAAQTSQTSNDDLRNIIPEKFVDKRRKGSSSRRRPTATYKRIASTRAPDAQSTKPTGHYAQIGLTIWRLRKSIPTDSSAKIIDPIRDATMQWTPIRVEASNPFVIDDLVRLSIESSIEGYLYVIDRGQYRDGSISDPKLIFPTTRTRGGDNRVKPGRLIEIPAQDDRPSYFRLSSSRGELVSELLTIVVAKEPIPDLSEQISSQPLALNKELLTNWQKMWGSNFEHFELAGGQGKAWTVAEQEAGADMTRDLTQDDAPPQTIFRLARPPNSPVLVDLKLLVRKTP